MTIRNRIKQNSAFQYVIQSLDILSPVGQRRLMDQDWYCDSIQLEQEWNRTKHVVNLLHAAPSQALIDLRHQLMCLHDIQGTLTQLSEHHTLTEVDLYEIKHLAYLTRIMRSNLTQLGLDNIISMPNLGDVFTLLDPDSTDIDNFYIYDSYDAALAPLRKELRQLQTDSSDDTAERQCILNNLLDKHDNIQQQIIIRLSQQLAPYAVILQTALDTAGYCDLLLAKAQQALDWHLCHPQIGDHIVIRGIIHPQLLHQHQERGLRYQPVDIAVNSGVCLITGANMAGKTVLLKALACVQLMAQYGFFIAAEHATLPIVDDVVCCIGDEQDELQGLSSFAAEILRISDNVQRSRHERLLLLIDEPARTTNPIEGCAIVRSLVTLLQRQAGFALVTTHYSGLGVVCQRLRVRGFNETLSQQPIDAKNINLFIDYSLIEDQSDIVPHEALRIAELLGCDAEMIKEAKASL